MTTIQLKKFGNILVSRPNGLECFNAIKPSLNKEQMISIDFDDVLTITPSWFDEFLTNLAEYMKGNVILLPTTNVSITTSLPIIASERNDYAAQVINSFLEKQQSTKA